MMMIHEDGMMIARISFLCSIHPLPAQLQSVYVPN